MFFYVYQPKYYENVKILIEQLYILVTSIVQIFCYRENIRAKLRFTFICNRLKYTEFKSKFSCLIVNLVYYMNCVFFQFYLTERSYMKIWKEITAQFKKAIFVRRFHDYERSFHYPSTFSNPQIINTKTNRI